MEKEDVCSLLATKLGEMQMSRKIDPSSLNLMKIAIEQSLKREKYWLSNKEIPPQTTFVLYHATRNTRIVLEKMHERFIHAAELRENPKVVDDAMTVFPELSEMCGFTDSLQTVDIKPEVLEFIRRRIRSLRNTAQRVQMLPTIEEEVKSVNKNELAKELGGIAENLRLNML
jgi:hypothetical protein